MTDSHGYFNSLQKRFAERDVTIGVFGLSKGGLRLAVRQAESGFKVICFDMRRYKLDMVRRGISFVGDISDRKLSSLVEQGLVNASDNYDQINQLDFLAICIPEGESMKPGCYNLSDISSIIAKYMRGGLIIGFEDFDKADNLKQRVEHALRTSGFRYPDDYLFGIISNRV